MLLSTLVVKTGLKREQNLSKNEREREGTKEGERRNEGLTTNCLKSFAVAKRQFDKATAAGQSGGSVWRWNNKHYTPQVKQFKYIIKIL